MRIPYGDQFDAAAFHEHFGTDHEIWESPWAAGCAGPRPRPTRRRRRSRTGKARHIVNTFGVAWATQRGQMIGGPGREPRPGAVQAEPRGADRLVPPARLLRDDHPPAHARVRHDAGAARRDRGRVPAPCEPHPGRGHARQAADDCSTTSTRPRSSTRSARRTRCLISDGGAAYVMTTPERARDLAQPVVEVGGVGLGTSASGAHWAQQRAFTSTPQVFAAPAAFAMAGLTPADVDVLHLLRPVHDRDAHADRGQRLLREGRRRRVRRRRHAASRRRASCRPTPTAACSRTRTCSASRTSSRSSASSAGRPPPRCPDAEVGVYGGYTGPQAATLILRRA